MCTPALRALRRRFPEARLTAAGRPASVALLEGLPWMDALVPLPARPGIGGMLRAGRRLRSLRPDCAVVFPHAFRTALLARMSGARVRVGEARDRRGFLLSHAVPPHRENGRQTPIYTAFEHLALVAALGCEDDGAGLELHAPPEDAAAVRALFGEGPVFGVAPGAAFGPSKLWPAERYAKVIDTLAAETGARCALITGPGEEAVAEAVRRHARTPLIDAQTAPPSIARLKAIVSALDLLVCNDTGPRHLAVAFGVPVVCVIGPTSPRYTDSPWERGEVLRIDVDCGPCQRPVCVTDHRCMTGIPPERVVAAARRWLRPA